MPDVPSGGGGGGMDAFWAIVIVIVMFTMWIQGGGPTRAKNEGLISTRATSSTSSSLNSTSNSGAGGFSVNDGTVSNTKSGESPFKGKVHIQSGNAGSTIQPNQEYITLYADYSNQTPVKIGGWVLSNGSGEHNYDVNGNEVKGQSAYVVIPEQGVALYNPYKPTSNVLVPITLKPGERATIVTGQVPPIGSVSLKDNFKTNRCLGYVADQTEYRFPFELRYNCPRVEDMININALSDACYDFVRGLPSCHTPKEYYIKDQGYCLERNCKLNSYCQNIIKKNINFQACFDKFSQDKDFVGPEWRVFLKRSWELWLDRRETISLFDSNGKLVDKLSY